MKKRKLKEEQKRKEVEAQRAKDEQVLRKRRREERRERYREQDKLKKKMPKAGDMHAGIIAPALCCYVVGKLSLWL
ncbi:hypothetical protein V6N13_091778 [Hibiscus sabdariffa]